VQVSDSVRVEQVGLVEQKDRMHFVAPHVMHVRLDRLLGHGAATEGNETPHAEELAALRSIDPVRERRPALDRSHAHHGCRARGSAHRATRRAASVHRQPEGDRPCAVAPPAHKPARADDHDRPARSAAVTAEPNDNLLGRTAETTRPTDLPLDKTVTNHHEAAVQRLRCGAATGT
jgi:hypothetical protein